MGTTHRIMIVTEANETVASGHLMECIILGRSLLEKGNEIYFWVNGNMQEGLKARIPFPYYEYKGDVLRSSEELSGFAVRNQVAVVVFNLRKIDNAVLERFRETSGKPEIRLICIDELGHRRLEPDVIINPMIHPYYYSYQCNRRFTQLYCGPQYLVLSPQFARFHNKEKKVAPVLREVVVSMGGVDRAATACALAGWLVPALPQVRFQFIIGGGAAYAAELSAMLRTYDNARALMNISNMAEVLYHADLLICAGGNTLHEAAAAGTPSLAIYSAPHEKMNAEQFEEKGFGICVGGAGQVSGKQILARVRDCFPPEIRERQSRAGKLLVDGMAYERVTDLICRAAAR